MSPASKWATTGGVILIGAILALYLARTDLNSDRNFVPKCSLHAWTGLHCPGCGNTRASQALLRGDVAGAVQQNILFVVALPFLVIGAARTWIEWMFPGWLRPLGIPWKWGYSLTLIGAIVVFSILRNIPVEPYSWLAPVPLTEQPVPGPALPDQGAQQP